jgi:hypothetical protein
MAQPSGAAKSVAGSIELVVIPLFFYLACFYLLTFPQLHQFSTHYFTDEGDGLGNIWNLWWTNKAITELHQSPWHTTFLYYPYGTSLLPHTLNPFNGILAIILLRLMTQVQAHNFIVVFTFVVSGITAFFLAREFTKSIAACLIAGFIFTFSEYHFSHAQGHLNLLSMEWIPLFVLCWYRMITRPRVITGVLAAGVLFVVLLCDYYYFLYCVLIGLLIFIWHWIRSRDWLFFLRSTYPRALGAFLFATLITSGPLVISLLILLVRDPPLGAHDPADFSLDLLGLIIPGRQWRFPALTSFYWSGLNDTVEKSVHLGFAVLFVLVYVWTRRRKLHEAISLWFLVFIVFALLALGPALHIGGREIHFPLMPYTVAVKVIPGMSLGGMPVRMISMAILAASVLAALGFAELLRRERRSVVIAAIVLVVLVFEYLPGPLPTRENPLPDFVRELKTLPEGAVYDVRSSKFHALYYQTVHQRPMAFGYIARVSSSVDAKSRELRGVFETGDYERLYREYGFRYLILPREMNLVAALGSPLYQNNDAQIYDLSNLARRQ